MKRIVSILLALLMLVSLTACGDDEPEVTSEEVLTESAAESETRPASESETKKVTLAHTAILKTTEASEAVALPTREELHARLDAMAAEGYYFVAEGPDSSGKTVELSAGRKGEAYYAVYVGGTVAFDLSDPAKITTYTLADGKWTASEAPFVQSSKDALLESFNTVQSMFTYYTVMTNDMVKTGTDTVAGYNCDVYDYRGTAYFIEQETGLCLKQSGDSGFTVKEFAKNWEPAFLSAHAEQTDEEKLNQAIALDGEGRYDEAFAIFMELAEKGDMMGMTSVGFYYECGYSVEADPAKALEWYLKSAELGEQYALARAANAYYWGVGTEKDYTKAEQYALAAAEQYSGEACYILGCIYLEEEEKQDFAKSLEYYMKSAELEYTPAYNQVGIIYSYGYGVTEDQEEAFKWFLKGAETGDDVAQYNVGINYLQGRGTKKDRDKAKEYLLLSAAQGYEYAIQELETEFGIKKEDIPAATEPAETKAGDDKEENKYAALSTKEAPNIGDFQWYTENVLVNGVPENVKHTNSIYDLKGDWKCLIIYDPDRTMNSYVEVYMNANISGTTKKLKVTLTPHARWIESESKSFNEDGEETMTYEGTYKKSDLNVTGSGSISIQDFYTIDGVQYAVGTYGSPDGTPAVIALVRP